MLKIFCSFYKYHFSGRQLVVDESARWHVRAGIWSSWLAKWNSSCHNGGFLRRERRESHLFNLLRIRWLRRFLPDRDVPRESSSPQTPPATIILKNLFSWFLATRSVQKFFFELFFNQKYLKYLDNQLFEFSKSKKNFKNFFEDSNVT